MNIVEMSGDLDRSIWAISDGESVELFPDVSFGVVCMQIYDWVRNQRRMSPALRIPVYHDGKLFVVYASTMAYLSEQNLV